MCFNVVFRSIKNTLSEVLQTASRIKTDYYFFFSIYNSPPLLTWTAFTSIFFLLVGICSFLLAIVFPNLSFSSLFSFTFFHFTHPVRSRRAVRILLWIYGWFTIHLPWVSKGQSSFSCGYLELVVLGEIDTHLWTEWMILSVHTIQINPCNFPIKLLREDHVHKCLSSKTFTMS